MDSTRPDKMTLRLMLIIAVLGAALALIGWYRYFSAN